MTSVPGFRWVPSARAASFTWVRSGPPASSSGVGTQRTATAASARTPGSVVAWKPAARMAVTSASVTSGSGERPASSVAVTAGFVSIPVTRIPAAHASRASGSPV